MAKRTDEHRPSAIEPTDYTHLLSFSHAGPDEPGIFVAEMRALVDRFGLVEAGARGGCGICGNWFRHGDVFLHRHTNRVILVGHICANSLDMAADRRHWLQLRRAADARRREARGRALARVQVRARLRELLRAHPGLNRALKVDHRISRDLRARLLERGYMSEKQVDLAFKLERDASVPQAPMVPVPETDARIEIVGRVVSTKRVDDLYGPQTKMLVEVAAEGGSFRLFGTAPSALLGDGELRGATVRFHAKVKRSDRDPSFGFYNRPTKPEIVERSKENQA